MSFTQTETAFAGVHELGINDLLRAFFTARPRHLNYGTPAFVPVTTVAATSFAPIAFPGATIHLAISFTIPTTDIHPDSSGGTSALLPGPGQFTVSTTVQLSVLCGVIDPNGAAPAGQVKVAKLGVVALCHPIVSGGEIGIFLDRIEIVDITPDDLESVMECLIELMLRAVLANFRLPFNTVTAGAFGLALVAGPLAEEDQIKVRGNVL